jgi:hypothetical protein
MADSAIGNSKTLAAEPFSVDDGSSFRAVFAPLPLMAAQQ